MRKLFTTIILAAATLFAVPAGAQLKFGLKGGLNITSMSVDKSVLESSNQTGFFIGPTVKFTLPIVGLGIDASALYDQRSSKLEDVVDGTTGKVVNEKLTQKSINVPINLRYDIGIGGLAAVYLAAGPQFGFNIGDKEMSLYDQAMNWKLKSSNLSVNVGAGVMLLGHLQVGANYNIACGKTGEFSVLDAAKKAYKGHYNTWQISAAYYF